MKNGVDVALEGSAWGSNSLIRSSGLVMRVVSPDAIGGTLYCPDGHRDGLRNHGGAARTEHGTRPTFELRFALN